ncbi:MAG: hypothetical protein ACXVY8_10705 [Gaiellaceae bacterium]
MRLRLGIVGLLAAVAVLGGVAGIVLVGRSGAPSTDALLERVASADPGTRGDAARTLADRLDPRLA